MTLPTRKKSKKPAKARTPKPAKDEKFVPKRDGPPTVEVLFDVRDSSYWFQIGGRYVRLSKSDLAMHCKVKGYRDDVYFNGLCELDWICWNAQVEKQVEYAGPLAGHRIGVRMSGNRQRYLVTTEPGSVWDDLPKVAEPIWFAGFIRELLPTDQWMFVCHWLAEALRSLRRGDFQPGQALILVGEARCGKSLLQQIITELLGGRSADPTRYLTGETQFNRDLAEAEHWMIEDPKSTTDIRARREFGDNLKSATVNRQLSIHAKTKDATLTLPVFHRVTLSLNNELENLSRCPPLDPSIADKVFLLKCDPAVKSLEQFRVVNGTRSLLLETSSDGQMDQAAIWKTVLREVPQIRAWLVSTFNAVAPSLRDDRFGIAAWHHPELLAELSALEAWERLLQLIDLILFTPDNGDARNVEQSKEITVSAVDLEMRLRNSKFAFEVEKVLKQSGMCGSYLGRLLKLHPKRISKRRLASGTLWTIQPPWAEEKPTNE